MKFYGHPVRSFNMEITNKCVLACSECDRTGNPWVKKNLTELPVELVQKLFPASARERLAGIKINLCGAFGDCIYHSRFHDIVRHLKDVGCVLHIETNGSHRPPEWWEKTCDLLGEEDEITFSVDGLQDTNHIYRVNSRWEDIYAAMKVCASRVRVHWKFIVFRHNEHQLEEAKHLAKALGIREITFKKSARFRAVDPLAPQAEDFIGTVARNRQKVRTLLAQGLSEEELDREVSIQPKCIAGRSLAITATGHFFPCTTCEASEADSWFHHHQERFSLRDRPLEAILNSPEWSDLQKLWERASQAPKVCLRTCGVHRDFQRAYAEESRNSRPHKPEDAVSITLSG
ncbi:MAG: radical SAM protein [Candidatus Methylomirabilota bacterium]